MSRPLSREQGEALLDLARKAIRAFLETGKTLHIKVEDKVLKEKRGAFVTLKVEGCLRGCIGYPLPHKPLSQAVIETAVSAASQDFRFRPLEREEMERMTIEVSVLGLPEKILDPERVEVGKHGIIVSKGSHRGLLLPQVPVEYGWDREKFLRHGCLKAGLDEDEWKKGADIEVFTAQVFTEAEPG